MADQPSVLHEIANIEAELDFITTLLKKQQVIELDNVEVRAAALSLSTVYNGIEKALVHALRTRSTEKIEGPNWHIALLERSYQAHLISEQTKTELKAFMAFRHFVRHAYSFEIDPVMIHKIINQCPPLVMRLKREITAALKTAEQGFQSEDDSSVD